VAFGEKRGEHTDDNEKKQPGREDGSSGGKGDQPHHLLDHATHVVEHVGAVRSLESGAFEKVLKISILEMGEVELGGVADDFLADFPGEFFGDAGFAEIDGSAAERNQGRKKKGASGYLVATGAKSRPPQWK
jgi:hypothetical protein